MSQQQLLDDDPDIPIDDPEIPLEDDPEIAIDEPAASSEPATPNPEPSAVSTAALVEILPADFPLPALLRFVPDVRLKAAADEATRYALAVEVNGTEGLARADAALVTLRTSLKAITESFAEPAELANDVHKRITGKRAEWLEAGANAVKVVGQRVATEQLRLKRIEEDERRKRQEEEDRKAREEARQRARQAEQQQAPPAVVEEMKKRAEEATAPPVAASTAPTLSGNTVTTTWKARIKGTPAHAEPLPESADYSPAQAEQIKALHLAVAEGRAPLICFLTNDSYLNSRAKAEKKALQLPGIEAFEDVGVRARPNRKK